MTKQSSTDSGASLETVTDDGWTYFDIVPGVAQANVPARKESMISRIGPEVSRLLIGPAASLGTIWLTAKQFCKAGPSPKRSLLARTIAKSPLFDGIGPTTQRGLIIGAVGVLHCGLIAVLLAGLSPLRQAEHEVALVLVGGPLAAASETPRPVKLVDPETAEAPPPVFEIVPTQLSIVRPMASATGTPTVTEPAMPIAEAHAFPSLPASLRYYSGTRLRLVLSIAPSGEIADARVSQTSGTRELDRLAVEWVKSHWRYTPALRNGIAIADTTTAVVAFTPSLG